MVSVGVLSALCGCSKAESQDESDKPTAVTRVNRPGPAESGSASTRANGVVWRSLLDEASRAEVDIGGIAIDLGTADQHKYTRGSWRTGWGDGQIIGDVTAAPVHGDRAVLDVVVADDVRELVVRARSAQPEQLMTAYLGKTRIGAVALTTSWQVARVPVASGLMGAGRHQLVLRFASQNGSGDPNPAEPSDPAEQTGRAKARAKARPSAQPSAQFDWLWLAHTAGAEVPESGARTLPIRIAGRPKRALVAPSARSHRFYLQPSADSRLVFDYGSASGATFAVHVRADGQAEEQLFSAVGAQVWREASVALGAYADRAIQLRLAVTGPPGQSGWGEPVIMRDGTNERPRKRGEERPKNAILLVLDTARADVYGPFARGDQVETPNFDDLAERSAIFQNAYNNENWTKPSVATTLSSLYPSTHDTKRDASVLPDDVQLLPQHLQKHGFRTAGLVANGYISQYFGFEKGWDRFVNYIRAGLPTHAENVFRDARSWLEEHRDTRPDEPFFLYIQTIDPHVVYDVPSKYRKRYYDGRYDGYLGDTIDANDQIRLARRSRGDPARAGRHRAWLQALYYGEISYHDEHLGRFLDFLRQSDISSDTLLVVTNDHGEELGERGFYGHGHSLYDEMIRAPLIMHHPAIFPAGTRIPDVVENVDIAPTIVDVLGVRPMPDAEGQSLLPFITGTPLDRPTYAISEFLDGRRAIRIGRYTFMRSIGKWMHLYDLVADPDQRENLVASHDIARRLCEVHLGEGLATPDKRKRQQDLVTRRRLHAGEAEISSGVRRQLSALGYFGDSEDRSEDDAQP